MAVGCWLFSYSLRWSARNLGRESKTASVWVVNDPTFNAHSALLEETMLLEIKLRVDCLIEFITEAE